jgi:hypothetical protein
MVETKHEVAELYEKIFETKKIAGGLIIARDVS